MVLSFDNVVVTIPMGSKMLPGVGDVEVFMTWALQATIALLAQTSTIMELFDSKHL